ncbi:hypothetical protein BUALT_Bualt19G0081800 [Buddleja alternifolia]|uniref:HhH-GPD domain-containing protein n=1 Tax=Buddleja alternifolia TaxID=168488 RepID=A0AAV6W5W3_9LAMI|nr:hypothetical protein BUALT_Bualt19G0081800 [Buddleja alternifolia]
MNWQDETTAAHGGVVVELPLGDAAPDFNLEKVVCSHGLFMMAPNRWDPHSKTLERPLRLDDDDSSFMVHISHPPHTPHALQLRVFGTPPLSPPQHKSLMSQVSRMLRLSEEENRKLKEFHKMHEEAKGRGFGRMFRSPTLFEDMIKCILLCNCQWSRTLSMAKALCELQSELQHPSSSLLKVENGSISSCQTIKNEQFAPNTPAGKESKKKLRVSKCSVNLANKYAEISAVEETDLKISSAEISSECSQETGVLYKADLAQLSYTNTGNFPSPRELASLDEKFLSTRCKLGYRAGRVINLAREVVEGRIQLNDFEYPDGTLSLSDYDKLFEKLRVINGFGPFSCANVLMCIGFYHVIPTDSETIRHLKQVHGKTSTIRTVQGDVEDIYGKYAPFQFLAYWSEIWRFYEERFGKLSEMPHSSHKLITATNMRPNMNRRSKRMKLSSENMHEDSIEKNGV